MLKILKGATFIILPFLVGITILWGIKGSNIQIVDWILKQVDQFAEQSFWELLAETIGTFRTEWLNLWAEEGNIFENILRVLGSIAIIIKMIGTMIFNLLTWLWATILHVFEMIGTIVA